MPNYNIKLLPSSYQLSNTSYLNISNPNNMYTDTNSTTYAQVNHTRTQTTSYYIYIRGFDFSQIPSNATINSAIVKVKALESGASTATPSLYNNTSSIGSTSFNGTIGTSVQTRTLDITSKWGTMVGYGSNLGVRLQLNRSSRNTASYLRIYGVEIAVEYSVPDTFTITSSATGATIIPNGATSVTEGDNYTLRIESDYKPTVIDNGVDVSSNVVEKSSDIGYEVSQASGASYGFNMNSNGYYESNNKGKASSTALSVVNMNLPVECTVKFTVINYAESGYDFGLLSNIDTTLSTSASADSSNVYWSGKNNNNSSPQDVTYTIPSGEHFIYVKYFKDSYTDSNNDSLQFKVTITPNEDVPSDIFYEYTISNVISNHTIVVTVPTPTEALYIKENNSWNAYRYAYKKINGVWVKQNNLSNLFDTSTNYVKGN